MTAFSKEGPTPMQALEAMADSMRCECIYWARIDGRMTNHHPNCKNFKEELFVKITFHDHGSYVQPLDKLNEAMAAEWDSKDELEAGQKWTLELVKMTREEYEALPDFAGH